MQGSCIAYRVIWGDFTIFPPARGLAETVAAMFILARMNGVSLGVSLGGAGMLPATGYHSVGKYRAKSRCSEGEAGFDCGCDLTMRARCPRSHANMRIAAGA